MRHPGGILAAASCAALMGTAFLPLASAVQYDLRPCLITDHDTETNPSAYMVKTHLQGFWTAEPLIFKTSDATFALDLEHSAGQWGKCNAIFIAQTWSPYALTTDQLTTIETYAKTYKVRVVYMNRSSMDTARLGIESGTFSPSGVALTAAGNSANSVVTDNLKTLMEGIWMVPVAVPAAGSSCTPVLEYTDAEGTVHGDSIAACTITPETDLEELHVFFDLAWWKLESWPWVHFMYDWATKGVFQGERRFLLQPVVDDLFSDTTTYEEFVAQDPTWSSLIRLSAEDMHAYTGFQTSLNSASNVEVIAEHPTNNMGILRQVGSPYVPNTDKQEDGLAVKGWKMPLDTSGVSPVYPTDWFWNSMAGLEAEYLAGTWLEGDELLNASIASLDEYFWQSHTLTHVMRDNIDYEDCYIEDAGNIFMAQLLGMYDHVNYNKYSMTNPGITGLFNGHCLQSQDDHLMKCSASDNSVDVLDPPTGPYHPFNTTEETNGYDGIMIIPRYATNIYYNCPTPACNLLENQVIYRGICSCTNPSDLTDNSGCTVGCFMGYATFEDLMDGEKTRVVRQLLAGHRDKYMFHQANMIRSTYSGELKSLLEIWVEGIVSYFHSFLKLPIESWKFDDLCIDFQRHYDLDMAAPVVTAIVDDTTGTVTSLAVTSGEACEHVPVTLPATATTPALSGTASIYKEETTPGPDKILYVSSTGSAPVHPWEGLVMKPIAQATSEPTTAGLTSYSLTPGSVTMVKGSLDSEQTAASVSLMESPDADLDESWTLYCDLVGSNSSADPGLSFEGTFTLPTEVVATAAEAVRLSVNFMGPTSATQEFTFDMFDVSQDAWQTVGNNGGVVSDWAAWYHLTFSVPGDLSSFVDTDGIITARVETALSTDSGLVDFMGLQFIA